MFRCEKCKKITKPGEKLHRYPILYRDKVYQSVKEIYRHQKIKTSYGKEIVKEINLCEECFLKYEKNKV